MKYYPIITFASVAEAIIAKSVVSTDPWACDALTGVKLGFSEDYDSVTASFPVAELYVQPPAHGYPGGNSSVGCGVTVEYAQWPYSNAHFAIKDVTWRIDDLHLSGHSLLDSLEAKVDFIVEVLDEKPWKNPVVNYITTATMLDVRANPALSNHSGPYTFTAQNSKLVWTNCLNYWVNNYTKMNFEIGGHTIAGGTSGPGWSMDLSLVWEPCNGSNEAAWGRTIVTESCSYSERNVTHSRKSKKLFPIMG
ncbi:hypothetical protein F5Y17DRAFT_12945 [Xylariaceae sp. FL0594]|nr:hypothetical protein F5Y17DRAFT_12945 [Xylariaceae sp. FL0594]